MSKTCALVLFLVLRLSESMVLDRVGASVVNRLGHERILNIHCKPRDNDLGFRKIPDGFEADWSFNVNIWGTTLFYCTVMWNDSNWHHFVAYSYKHDVDRCATKCVWTIEEDGLLCLYNQETGDLDFVPYQNT